MTRLGHLQNFLQYFIVLLAIWWTAEAVVTSSTRTKFKAAVFGHALIPPPNTSHVVSRADALVNMKKNLDVYRIQAREARLQGAEILVFPEDGIYGFIFTRDTIYPYLEYIPDPNVHSWSPCSEPGRYPDTEVQRALSCMAKENSLYLVANMGDKQPCDIQLDPNCPADGRYQYNTDVAFGPDGTLLARYHKYHLFYEDQFDTPVHEIVFFDTPFGRFGLMVCFDVLFYEPGVPMVLSNNISNIVFPTAWMDALPLLSALGFHSSFARGLGVNFLSADIHLPEFRFHGSGIYSPEGMKAFYYGTSSASPPKLLVAELDVLERPRPNIQIPTTVEPLQTSKEVCSGDNHKTDKTVNLSLQGGEFSSDLFFDNFTFTTLDASSGSLRVCQKDVCCDLQYEINETAFGQELFAFGAFDGLHTYEGQYYFQICTVVKCADASNKTSCGAVTHTSATPFKKIAMQSQMQTPFIYPQIVLSNSQGELQLAEAESWGFQNSSLWTNTPFDKSVLSAALYGRDYSRDNCSETANQVSGYAFQDTEVMREDETGENGSAYGAMFCSLTIFGIVSSVIAALTLL